MDKETFILTYIEIETKTFVRADRNKKLNDLFEQIKKKEIVFNAIDTIQIIRHLNLYNITIRQPLFFNILYPILSNEVDKNNVDAIKSLIGLEQQLISYQGYTKEYNYTTWELINKGLAIRPDDKELLKLLEKKMNRFILNTLHELPIGVLYGMDGASIKECDELIEMTDEYENLCKKLDIDQEGLIKECRYYYPAYKKYLSIFKNYNGFADYLEKEHSWKK